MTNFDDLPWQADLTNLRRPTRLTNCNSVKYRTIKQCFDIIKENDNNTAITPYYIRKLCREKRVAFISSGNKILVNLNSLLDYLNIGEKAQWQH